MSDPVNSSPVETGLLTLRDVEEACQKIQGEIPPSLCLFSRPISLQTGCQVFLKMENQHMTGSFKERGALNKLLSLPAGERVRGVITASAGNHAQGVAYHAHRLGCPAIIVMPEGTPINKINATKRHGAKIVLHGLTYDESYEEAFRIREQEGLNFIHAFDDPKVMAGQGTIGLEILREDICPDAVVVPIGGGGLISGIAVAIKEKFPSCRVYGVQAANAPSMKRSLEAGRITASPSSPTVADGIAVKNVGQLTFPIISKYVDDVVLVDESEIAASVLTLLESQKTLVEGAGAAPLAALAYHRLPLEGKRVVLILSGGNMDINLLSKIIERGLVKDGRMAKLRIELQDTPGQLARVSAKVAKFKANVIEVYHNRSFMNAPLGKTFLDITLETRGMDHVQEIVSALVLDGYRVEML